LTSVISPRGERAPLFFCDDSNSTAKNAAGGRHGRRFHGPVSGRNRSYAVELPGEAQRLPRLLPAQGIQVEVAKALRGFGVLVPLPNTWVDNWVEY
jgi:hypothetical protein